MQQWKRPVNHYQTFSYQPEGEKLALPGHVSIEPALRGAS